jgi:hypothetical protein
LTIIDVQQSMGVVKLFRLLEQHDRWCPKGSLPIILGDGFLLEHNSLYRAMRKAALGCDFIFSSEFDPAYLALPLAQLESLIERKKVPFFDNVTVLRDVERKIPRVSLWDEVVDNLKRNYVFHESCHAVFHTERAQVFPNDLDRESKILQILLEESFANTCELIGVVEAEDPIHRIFYEVNSYILMFDYRSLMKELIRDLGFELIFRFMLLCYLHANFLYERIEDRTFDGVMGLLIPDAEQKRNLKKDQKNLKKLRSLSKAAFQLNPRFRQVTNGFYLKMIGVEFQNENNNKRAEPRAIDFLSRLESHSNFSKLVDSMVSLVLSETRNIHADK